MPTTAPFASFVTFSVISVLASSISSRISSEAFSEISWTAWPRSEVGGWLSAMSVEDPLEDARDEERADERGADHHLGALRRLGQLVGPREERGPRAVRDRGGG